MATGTLAETAVTLGPRLGMDSSRGVVGIENTDVPIIDLNFREHMWDRFDIVLAQRSEPTRRLLDEVVACLRDRAQLERTYAKGLARNVLRLNQHLEGEHISPEAECIVANMKNRAEQSAELADELESDVASTIDIMLKQHAEVSKRVVADGQRLMKNYGDAKRVHQSTAMRYHQACVDAEAIARDCMRGVHLRPSDRARLGARAVSLSRQATAAERDYRRAVQRMAAASELQSRQMGLALAALQEIEEKRALCFRDAAMKIAVYETSFLRNVQYDVDGGVQVLEGAEALAGLQAFVVANRSPAPPQEVGVQGFWELSPATDTGAPGASGGAAREGERALSAQLSVARPIVQALLIGCGPVDSGALDDLRRGLSGSSAVADAPAASADGAPTSGGASLESSACRAAFCEAMREAISSTSGQDLTLTAPEELLPVQLGQSTFDAVVSLFMAALDGCDREADAWNGRDLMVLTQKVQVCADEKVVDTLVRVYTHPLWSRVTFWEDVLVMGLTEAYAHQAIGRRQQPTGVENADLVTTAFLQRFVGFMAAFGIRLEQAHGCVRRTLKKHAEVFGSTTEDFAELLTRNDRSLVSDPTAALAEPVAAPVTSGGRVSSLAAAAVVASTPLQLTAEVVDSMSTSASISGQHSSLPPEMPQWTAGTSAPPCASSFGAVPTAASLPLPPGAPPQRPPPGGGSLLAAFVEVAPASAPASAGHASPAAAGAAALPGTCDPAPQEKSQGPSATSATSADDPLDGLML